jgi:hypothetical protein
MEYCIISKLSYRMFDITVYLKRTLNVALYRALHIIL